MKLYRAFVFCLAAVVLLSCQAQQPTSNTPSTTVTEETEPVAARVDYESLAQKLVATNAGIKEGDLVQIAGGVRDAELLEAIAVNVRKLGAHPIVVVTSDRMAQRTFKEVDAKYDSQTPEFDLKLASLVTARIIVDATENDEWVSTIPQERRSAVAKASAPIGDVLRNRRVRQVFIGNDLYPTEQRAKRFGVPKNELSKMFWDALAMDYSTVQEKGRALKAALAGGKELHITNPNGTDLTVRIEGRPVFVSDGIIEEDDLKLGGAAGQAWLPGGEVYFTPVPGTAEGKLVSERVFYLGGKEIQGLTLTFKAGRIVEMTAKSGLDVLKADYDKAGDGKDELGAIDFGLNPNVRIPTGSRMVSWVPAGMVTLVIGNNAWAGGANNEPFGFESFIPGSTVMVDGKTIIENGEIKL